jgi:CheY-like chemotaxis protein
MSHELRTPLSAILGFAQLIESSVPPPTPPQARSVEQILKAGWYLLELINEILDLALIESGKLLLSMEPMSLTEVMLECQMMIEPQALDRRISVEFPVLQTEHHVKADRTRVKQVLINLLSNAIKYNRRHGTVVVTCAASSNGRIRIAVEDSGEGLSAEKLDQLFEPFNRLGKETGVEEGTGIGLVVSRRLVDLMGGEIGATSVVDVGSVFWIELDSADAALVIDRSIAEDAPAAVGIPLEVQRTLLYVEDNPANLMLVEDLIGRRSDIRLIHARDGIRGVEMALKFQPDVILMDINLPGISGIQALNVLAQQAPHIPVVALSANALPRDIEKGLEAGFFRYLTKPIKINEFMAVLDETLAFVKTQAALAPQVEPTL